MGSFPRVSAGCVRADFRSGTDTIRAEQCGPASGRRAVVVLHGCGGFSTFDHQLAVGLPHFGITTLYLDYFASTPPPGARGFCSLWTLDPKLFGPWERVAAAGARVLRKHFAAVGAAGWSLGAGVALAAGEDDHAFRAIAAFSAIAYPQVLSRAATMPATIFLSGGSRDIVHPINARRLYAAANRSHIAAQLFIYPNGTHDWAGKQGQIGLSHAASFLQRYLTIR
jgi:dienelactone hydrolase